MSIQKILPSEVTQNGVASLSARPSLPSLYEGRQLSAKELREAFDKLPRLLVERFNALLDGLGLYDGTDPKETLAELIATGLREGHSLADMLADIQNGSFAAYLSADGANTLSELLEALKERTSLPYGYTTLRSYAESIYRLSHVNGDPLSLCLEVYKADKGSWERTGVSFSISKDAIIKEGSVKTVTADDIPEKGYRIGDKYLDLLLAGKAEERIYIKVSDLVDSISVASVGGGDIVSEVSHEGNHLIVTRGIDSKSFALQSEVDAAQKKAERTSAVHALRLDSIETALAGNVFSYLSDGEVAYQKPIPQRALPYAELERLGGMTETVHDRIENEIGIALGFEETTVNGVTFSYNTDTREITINGTATADICEGDLILGSIGVGFAPTRKDGTLYDWEYEVVSGSVTEESACLYFEAYYSDDAPDIGMCWDVPLPSAVGVYPQSRKFCEGSYSSFSRVMGLSIEAPGGTVFDNYVIRIDIGKGKYKLSHAPVTALQIQGKNLFPETINDLNTWTPVSPGSGNGRYIYDLDLPFDGEYTVSGTNGNAKNDTYFYLYESNDGFVTYSVTHIFPTYGFPYTFTKRAGYKYHLRWYESASSRLANMQSLQLEHGSTATQYAPHTEAVLSVPEAVQALDGYGMGISHEHFNYIDLEKKAFVRTVGQRTYKEGDANGEGMLTDGETTLYLLDTPEITDISDLLDTDEFIEVEGGGVITLENAEKRAVPSTLVYQIKLTEGENA